MNQEYKMCTRCIMDTSDPDISFDSNDVCNHCINFDNNARKIWDPSEAGKKNLDLIIENIKRQNKKRS